MKSGFVESHRGQYPVQRMCRVLEVSPSGYYAWRKTPPSERELANRDLLKEIRQIHAASRKTYGSRRVHAELRGRGFTANKKRVARLMRIENIRGWRKTKRKTTTNGRHGFPLAPNRLNRDFTADRPDEKWTGDITYISTAEGWLYLAVIEDLYSRKIVGWSMEDHMESSLVEQAFQMATQARKPVEDLLHHSDRGSQYAGDAYQTRRRPGRFCPA